MQFHYHPEEALWESDTKVTLLGTELKIWLADESGEEFEAQQRLLSFALEILPSQTEACREGLWDFYQSACGESPDLVGTGLLPELAGPESVLDVFTLAVLELPEQVEGRGITFKIMGSCLWDEEYGVQLFFRDGELEQVDSNAALYY